MASIDQIFLDNDRDDVLCLVELCNEIENENAGVIFGQNAFSPGFAAVLGISCFDIENNGVGGADNLNGLAQRAIDNMVNSFIQIVGGQFNDVAGDPAVLAVANGNVNLLTVDEVCTAAADNQNVVARNEVDDEVFLNVAAIYTINAATPRAPGVFCLDDSQCRGVRDDDGFGETVRRTCQNLDNDDEIPECNDFVAFFTLRWLLFFIVATYVILLLWALYWTYPWLKSKFCGKKANKPQKETASPMQNDREQLLVNTLAAQCASAENLLFQATDMLKQARNMENILAVEAKRESKVMIYTVEFFQATCAILVSLTHGYIHKKANDPAENWNADDATTRALQLEVLNYVRDRLALAFNADSMTDKSLLRIAEAYAVLRKITESLVFVGFDLDKKVDNSLGNLKTPFVDLTEDAIFLSGTYKNNTNMPGTDQFANQKVCITIEGAADRNMPRVPSSAYLTNQQRDAKIYDPYMEMVKPGVGKSMSFTTLNQAQTGEGLQFFVRSFWENEINAIQSEAQRWLRNDGALEGFLDMERRDREERASPMLKRTHKKKRRDKKNKKKRRNKDGKTEKTGYSEKGGYTDAGDSATEYSGYTEASGWSVEEGNNYVYNVSAVVNQGLGIAGKPGMPYDKPGESPVKKGSKAYQWFEKYFPNVAEWPKFYIFVFVVMPIIIMIPMLAKARQGSTAIDQDGNVDFKARPAGFGFSFLGVPAYYFLDGEVPEVDDLVIDAQNEGQLIIDQLPNIDPFETGTDRTVFMANAFSFSFVNAFQGSFGRNFDISIAEIQSGVLSQPDVAGLDAIRDQQVSQEMTTVWLYALMHVAAYFFGIIPITLVRESLEILARRFTFIRDIYPMSLWRELHMSMGLGGIFFVAFGATVFLVTHLVGIGKSTPFAGLAGDPNIASFFDLEANVLYIRQLLLPAVPLLLLMKYASRGPPTVMVKYAPTIITKNYWEICYFLHYFTALTAIIVLVIYRPQVFYWMGATWGFVWGGNKIVRILRTRKTTIKNANLVSYTVEDKRNNAKKRSDVLRITLNVPSSFPSSARGQACWLTVPQVDYIAHPFTLAKVPTETDKTIMFHMAVRYLPGDDVITLGTPDEPAAKPAAAPAPPTDPNALPTGWKSAVDPNSGQTYYFNSAEKRTTWNRPKANAVDKLFDGVRGITTRMSANFVKRGTTNLAGVGTLDTAKYGQENTKTFQVAGRATWTQNFAKLAYRLQTMDPDLKRNAVKNFPVYVSAPLGTSMDDCLLPSLPGSIIITTQNGLPAAESSVRWLLKQGKTKRPKFHFFVSVSRELNDALSVVETLRDAMCDSVAAGHLDIEGVSRKHAHMADWLGVYIHLTRRKAKTIAGDREVLMRSLNPPAANITDRQLELINDFIKNRVQPGRLPFDRFLARTQQMVRKRTGVDNMAVGYCGSAKVAYSIRSACRALERVKFDGEFI